MPWKAIKPMDERVRFIAAVQADPCGNFARLCRSFGISRAKGYKWVGRYEAEGPAGLADRKRPSGVDWKMPSGADRKMPR